MHIEYGVRVTMSCVSIHKDGHLIEKTRNSSQRTFIPAIHLDDALVIKEALDCSNVGQHHPFQVGNTEYTRHIEIVVRFYDGQKPVVLSHESVSQLYDAMTAPRISDRVKAVLDKQQDDEENSDNIHGLYGDPLVT